MNEPQTELSGGLRLRLEAIFRQEPRAIIPISQDLAELYPEAPGQCLFDPDWLWASPQSRAAYVDLLAKAVLETEDHFGEMRILGGITSSIGSHGLCAALCSVAENLGNRHDVLVLDERSLGAFKIHPPPQTIDVVGESSRVLLLKDIVVWGRSVSIAWEELKRWGIEPSAALIVMDLGRDNGPRPFLDGVKMAVVATGSWLGEMVPRIREDERPEPPSLGKDVAQ